MLARTHPHTLPPAEAPAPVPAPAVGAGRHAHGHGHMSRKNESVAWRAFVKLGGNKVVCRICGKQMNYQSGSSTSNMVKHLQAVHKHILADSPCGLGMGLGHNPASSRFSKHNTSTANPAHPAAAPASAPAPAPAADADDLTSHAPTEPWMVLQHAPAHLRQRWQDLKLGLQKEMQQHQQAVAWSTIGAPAPCLGAPAGADLLTDSQPCTPCWGSSSTNNTSNSNTSGNSSNNNNNNSSNSSNNNNTTPRDPSCNDHSVDWQDGNEDSCEMTNTYHYRVKPEPIETDDATEPMVDRSESTSPPPQALSPPPRSPVRQHHPSPIVLSPSAPGGDSVPPPSTHNDGPPPPKNKKHTASQTSLPLPSPQQAAVNAELELRLEGLRRAQQRAEELHHEHLRESRARAEAAQAERDHRLQLIRHAEEIHRQALEAQKQALEQSRQLHEITLRHAQKSSE